MPKVQYLHSSYGGTYFIDCEIIKGDTYENLYTIKYIDPATNKTEYRLVTSSQLKFPEFSEFIGM